MQMAASQPGARYTGLWYDPVNNRLAFYFRGTAVGNLNATTLNIDVGTDIDGTLDLTGATVSGNTIGISAASAVIKQDVVRLGSTAAVASNGAGAILPDSGFVAPFDMKIVAAYKVNMSASDVTVGTAVSSASYRRFTLIANTAASGSGTDIVASLNATASAASNAYRSFTTVASTVPAGALVRISHLTVGADTADGTDAAAGIFLIAYEKV